MDWLGDMEIFWTWFVVGSLVAIMLHLYLKHMVRDLQRQAAEFLRERVILLTVELENGHYFCYNTVTNEFVCQGASPDEITQNFRQRFPHKRAYVYAAESSVFDTLKSHFNADNASKAP